MSKYTEDKLITIAEELLGTANDLEDQFYRNGLDFYECPTELLSTIDELTMRCETCSWWSESDEMDDNQNCKQCQSEEP